MAKSNNIAVVICDNQIHLVEPFDGHTKKQIKALKDMGSKIRIKFFPNYAKAEEFEASFS